MNQGANVDKWTTKIVAGAILALIVTTVLVGLDYGLAFLNQEHTVKEYWFFIVSIGSLIIIILLGISVTLKILSLRD